MVSGFKKYVIRLVFMYGAIEVANYIIEYEHSQKRIISNLKLQKLLYFVQANFFRRLGISCFSDKIEAWSFGPVVVNVYHAYKYYGGLDITKLKDNVNICIDQEHKNVINEVLEKFAVTPFYELVDITKHQTPYIEARRRGVLYFDNTPEITIQDIRMFFKGDKD